MQVTFKNIGPVLEASFDTNKPLQIICGPNNTGKTYLAYCLYGFLKLREADFRVTRIQFPELKFVNDSAKIDFFELYKLQRSNLKSFLERSFLDSLPSIFGLDKEMSDIFFNDADISVVLPTENNFQSVLNRFILQKKFSVTGGFTFELRKLTDNSYIDVTITKKPSQVLQTNIYTQTIYRLILQEILLLLLNQSYISPVERNSIFTFSKELAIQRNNLIDQMLELKDDKSKGNNPLSLLRRRAMRYPMPIRDGLEIAEDLITFKKQISDYSEFATSLETDILQGKVSIGKDGEVLFSPNRAKERKLPIHLSASVVKSFSSLIIYFRHLAQTGDCIIIDEPELNLHPDAQILVARMLSRIANKGFKVVISTHSDYIIRELNNLMMIYAIRHKKGVNIPEGYTEENGINPSNVEAYLFQYGERRNDRNKVNVETIKVTEEGIEVPTIDSVITSLNSLSQELFFELNTVKADD